MVVDKNMHTAAEPGVVVINANGYNGLFGSLSCLRPL